MKKKRKFMTSVGTFRPAFNGKCLISHAKGDLILLTYCLVGRMPISVVYD